MNMAMLFRNRLSFKNSNLSSALQLANLQKFKCAFSPADMPVVKQKWQAAEKVGKICETMKNVAAAGLPGAEKHLANCRAFGLVTAPLFQLEKDPDNIKKVLHIAVGTERGLCGAMSSNTVREIQRYITERPNQDYNVVVYGKRSASVANTLFGDKILIIAAEVKTRVPTFEFCCHLAEFVLREATWDKIRLYYNVYVSAVKFQLQTADIYKTDIAKLIADIQFPSYEVEGDENTIIENLIEFKLASLLYLYLGENYASEQGARLASMDGATKNCKEKVLEYEKIYQTLRKNKITDELIILGTGAKMALKKKK